MTQPTAHVQTLLRFGSNRLDNLYLCRFVLYNAVWAGIVTTIILCAAFENTVVLLIMMTSLDEEYNKFTWLMQKWFIQTNTWAVSIRETSKSVSHTKCPSEDLVGRYILGVVDCRLRGGTGACSVSENVPSSESISRLLRLLWDWRHLVSFSFRFGQARCTSFSLQGSRSLSNTESTKV